VTEPNGTRLTYAECYTSQGGCQLSMTNLPATGTYTVTIEPPGQTQIGFTITLSQDVTANLTPSTTPINVTLVAGQNVDDTFTATAGQSMTLYVGSIATNPSGQTVTATVYNSAGTSVGVGSGTSSFTINLTNLAAGTYTVVIVPVYGGSATMQETFAPVLGGTLTANGVGVNEAASVPGQYGYFLFSGTAGQSLALALTSLTLNPTSAGNIYVAVNEPNGTRLAYAECYTSQGSCELDLPNLPVTGTYTLTIEPPGQTQIGFTETLSQDLGGTLALNTPQNLTPSAVGQNAWLTFTIASAQTVTVTDSSISSSPASTTYAMTVYNSAGTSMGTASSTTGTTLTLTNLAAGTYNILISPGFPATATLQVNYQ
jgi:hypothetical protein